MQQCPLAGSECGLMVRAKPWEASEVARQSLSGRSPVCGVCVRGLLLLQIPCPFFGTLESSLLGGVFFSASRRTGSVAVLSRFPFDVPPTVHFSLLLHVYFSLSVQFVPFLPAPDLSDC